MIVISMMLVAVGCGEDPKLIHVSHTGMEGDTRVYLKSKRPVTGAIWREPGLKQTMMFAGFKDGKRHGKWIEWHPNGRLAVMARYDDFLDGRRAGPRTEWYPTGQVKKKWVYEQGEGKTREWDESGKKKTAWSYDKGRAKAHYPSGKLKAEGTKKDGKRHGVWTLYYDNGQKQSEGAFLAGQEDGPWVLWHENGKKAAQGEFKKGKEEGDWLLYRKDGSLKLKCRYEAGKKVKCKLP